eukprot:scaffold316488_cov18-Prasinocladus_malaysianus.AAC.1
MSSIPYQCPTGTRTGILAYVQGPGFPVTNHTSTNTFTVASHDKASTSNRTRSRTGMSSDELALETLRVPYEYRSDINR